MSSSMTFGRYTVILAVMAVVTMGTFTAHAAWPELPTHKTYVVPGYFPKNGQGDYSSSGFDVGQVRNTMETTYEGWWREYSYYRANPDDGTKVRGYYMDTKTVGEVALPWAWGLGVEQGSEVTVDVVLGTSVAGITNVYTGTLPSPPVRGRPFTIQIGTLNLTDTTGNGQLVGDGVGIVNLGTGGYEFQLRVAAPEGTEIVASYTRYIQDAVPSPGAWANFSAVILDPGQRFPDGRGEHFDELEDDATPSVVYGRVEGEDIVRSPVVDGFWTPGERYTDRGGSTAPNGVHDQYVHAEDRWHPVRTNGGIEKLVLSPNLRDYIDLDNESDDDVGGDFFFDYDFSITSVSTTAPNQVVEFDGLKGMVRNDIEIWIADRGRKVNVQHVISEFDLTPPLYVGGDTEVSLETQFAEDRWSPVANLDTFAKTYLGDTFYNFLSRSSVGDAVADYDYSISQPSDGSTPIASGSLGISTNVTVWIADTSHGTNVAYDVNEFDLTPPRYFATNTAGTLLPRYDRWGFVTSDSTALLEGDASHTYVRDSDPANTNTPVYADVPNLARFEYQSLGGGTVLVYHATSPSSPIEIKTYLPETIVDTVTASPNTSINGLMYVTNAPEPRIIIDDLETVKPLLNNAGVLGFSTPLPAGKRIPLYVTIPVYYAASIWGQPADTANYTNAVAGTPLNAFEDAVGNDGQWTDTTNVVVTSVGELTVRYDPDGVVTNDDLQLLEGDAAWENNRDDTDPPLNTRPAYTNVPALERLEYNVDEGGLPHVYLAPFETILYSYVDLPNTLHENILNQGSSAGFTLTNNALHVFDPPLNFFTAPGGYVADGQPLVDSNAFIRVEVAVHVPLFYSRPIWGEPANADTYTILPSSDPLADPFIPIDNQFLDAVGEDDQWTDAIEAEWFSDFISWWDPLGGEDGFGAWVGGLYGTPVGTLPPDTEPDLTYWSYTRYTNYIANNYPGNVEELISRCGNSVYDGPESWAEVDNNQYQQTAYIAGLFSVHMFEDYSVGPDSSYADWWHNRYGTASYDLMSIPAVSEWNPPLTDQNQGTPSTSVTNLTAIGTVVVTTWSDVTHPPFGTTWTYDSPREFDDLASSLYHNPELGSASALAMRTEPNVNLLACWDGGDMRLGERTSPWGGSIFGQDRGDSIPGTRDVNGGDGSIPAAGPYAYNTHANYGHDAANQLSLEFSTWRTDGESLTTGIGHSPGGHIKHLGYDYNTAIYAGPSDAIAYARDHRDVNLNGLIDQGETVPDQSHNYLTDADGTPTRADNGMDTMALFGWERCTEDYIDTLDAIEDFEAITTFTFPTGTGNEMGLAQPSGFSWDGDEVASNSLATLLGASVLYTDTDGDSTYTPGVDGVWVDAVANGTYDALESLIHDPTGVGAVELEGTGPVAVAYADLNTNGVYDVGQDLVWIDANTPGVFDSEAVLIDGRPPLEPGNGDAAAQNLRSSKSIYVYPSATNYTLIWAVTNDYAGATAAYGGTNGVDLIYVSSGADAVSSTTGVLWNAVTDGTIRYVSDGDDIGYYRGLSVFIDADNDGLYDGDMAVSVPGGSLIPSYSAVASNGGFNIGYTTTNAMSTAFSREESTAWKEVAAPNDQRNGEIVVSESIPLAEGTAADGDVSASIQWIDVPGSDGTANGSFDPLEAVEGVGGEGAEFIYGDAMFYDYDLNGRYNFGRTAKIPLYVVGLMNQTGLAGAGVLHSGNVYGMMTRDTYIAGFNQNEFIGANMPSPALLAHEQGHDTPGWPDMYDYDVSTEEVNNNAGSGDLYSDSGLVHGYPDMKRVVGVRFNELNYGSNAILTKDGGPQTLRFYPVERYADQYYVFRNEDVPWEYFILHFNAGDLTNTVNSSNEQPSPYASPFGRGVQICHTDYGTANGAPQQQRSNNRFTWAVVQADGLYQLEDGINGAEPADLFGMTPTTKQFTDSTIPPARWFDGDQSGLRVLDIRIPSEPYGPAEVVIEWVSLYNGSTGDDWFWVSDGDDSDGDGIPDAWEYYWFTEYTNALAMAGADTDYDGDGLSDYGEWLAHANPTWQSSWTNAYGQHVLSDADYDVDGDGLSNADEVDLYNTDPFNDDTDDDGYSDGEEINWTISCGTEDVRNLTSPTFSRAPFKQHSLALDGSPVNVPSAGVGSIPDRFDLAEWTIECWVKTTNDVQTGNLICRETDQGRTNFALRLDANQPSVQFTTGAGTRYTAGLNMAIPTNEWTHLAGVWAPEQGSLWLYVNGVARQAQASVEPCARGLGGTVTLGDGVQGLIDEVRIWGSARSAEQIQRWEPRILSGFKEGKSGDVNIAVAYPNGDPVHERLEEVGLPYTFIEDAEIRDPATYETYTAIFFPCLCPSGPAGDSAVQDLIRDFVSRGGNLYVACWSGAYVDEVWPEKANLSYGPYYSTTANIVDPEVADYVGSDTLEIPVGYDCIDSYDSSVNKILEDPGNIGLISFSFTHGSGKVVYTDFHSEPGDSGDSDQARFLQWVVQEVAGTEGTFSTELPIAYYTFDDGGLSAEDYANPLDDDYALASVRFSTDDRADLAGMFDSEIDGIPDWWQSLHWTNYNGLVEVITTNWITVGSNTIAEVTTNYVPAQGDWQPELDADEDLLTTLYEFYSDTNPRDKDTDNDGVFDSSEDRDLDGLPNIQEQAIGSRPDLYDTDDDGLSDGQERDDGTNPADGFSPFVERVLTLDGNGYVEVPKGSDGVRLELESLTVEAWVSPQSMAQACTIARRQVGPNQHNFYLGIDTNHLGQLVPFFRATPDWDTSGDGSNDAVAMALPGYVLPSYNWIHLAGSIDKETGEVSLYINGSVVETAILDAPVMTHGVGPIRLRVGEGFDGSIDEVRVWDSARGVDIADGMHSRVSPMGEFKALLERSADDPRIIDHLGMSSNSLDAINGISSDGLVASYRFDDGGETAEDGTSTADWMCNWVHAARFHGTAIATNPPFGGAPIFGLDEDSDQDDLPDAWEMAHFGSLAISDGTGDYDNDLLNDLYEYFAGTSPKVGDSDGDGTLDRDENPDGDGLLNWEEQEAGTRPDLADTDDDGVGDDVEVDSSVSSPLYGMGSFALTERSLRLNTLPAGGIPMPQIADDARANMPSWTAEASVALYPDATSHSGILLRKLAGPLTAFELGLTAGIPYVSYQTTSAKTVICTATSAIAAQQFVQLAGTWDETGKVLRLYVDGTAVAEVDVNDHATYAPQDIPAVGFGSMSIGIPATTWTGSPLLDNVRVWNAALAAAELNQYRFTYVPMDSETRLVRSYRFDDGGAEADDFAHLGDERLVLDSLDYGIALQASGHAGWLTNVGVTCIGVDDSDGDGMPDWFESFYKVSDPDADADDDGLSNYYEYLSGTNPTEKDTDGDGTFDGGEYGVASGATNDLTNAEEQRYGSDSRFDDTDDDGISDSVEVADDADGFTLPNASLSPARAGVLSLTSADQYVSVPNQTKLIQTGSWTVEAWVRLDASFSGSAVIVGRDHGQTTNYELGFDASRRPYVRFAGLHDTILQVREAVSATALDRRLHWYHLAGVYDADAAELRLYVDGIAEAQTSVAGGIGDLSYVGAQTLRIGEGFIGQIDEVRIWDSALSRVTLGVNAYETFEQSSMGPVSYFRFDDFGTTAEDFAGPAEDWLQNWMHAGMLVNGATMSASSDSPIGATVFSDEDDDGVPDFWEVALLSNLDAAGESDDDMDGLTLISEYQARLHPLYGSTFDDATWDDERDLDNDGLSNAEEQEVGTRPDMADTDDDGQSDYEEVTGMRLDNTHVGKSNPLRSLDPTIPRGVELDGSSRVVVPAQGRHALEEWTLSAWIRPDDGSDGGVVVARTFGDRSVNYELGVESVSNALRPYVRYHSRNEGVLTEHNLAHASAGTVMINNPYGDFMWVTPGAWSHLAATYSPSNSLLSLYVDGELVGVRTDVLRDPFTGGGPGVPLAGELTIGGGAMDDAGTTILNGFEGAIDDVRLSSIAASAVDVRVMMNGQPILDEEDGGITNGTTMAAEDVERLTPEAVEGEFLVGVISRDELGPVRAEIMAGGMAVAHTYRTIPVMHVKLAEGDDPAERYNEMKAMRGVTYVERNYKLNLSALPNDPSFSEMWGLHNTGADNGVEDADIDAPEAWDIKTGGNVIVAVIDSGIDYNHQDLADNMWVNLGETAGNGIDDDGNGYVDDVNGYDFGADDADPMDDVVGHGTHCAGTIGAVGNNSEGVVGVNWRVKLMALKIADDAGGLDLAGAIEAIEYAWQMGARVSNNSWGGYGFSQALYDAVQVAGENGHLFVAAAANDSNDNDQFPAYPASFDLDNVVSVAATDRRDELAYFSNYGRTTVDLGAPGVEILSTLPLDGSQMGTEYGEAQGTSMATPHVAGAAALLLAADDRLSHEALKAALLENADPVADLDGRCVTGARLNVLNAMPKPREDEDGLLVVRGLAGWFRFDDGGERAEDFTLAAGWRRDWRYAGRLQGSATQVYAAASTLLGDTDDDSLPDWWEEAYGLDPLDSSGDSGKDGDPDGDGLRNQYEYLASLALYAADRRGLSPWVADSDNDGVSDALEDSDGDAIANLNEQNIYLSHPGWADTDDDDDADGEELTASTLPCDSATPYRQTALTFSGGTAASNTVVFKDKVGADFTERYSSAEWTVELWVNPSGPFPSGNAPLITRSTYATGRRNYEIGISNGVPYTAFDGVEHGASVALPEGLIPLETSTWTHLAARFEEGDIPEENELSLFVNGKLVAITQTGWRPATGPGDLTLGSAGFAGQLSNVRVWKIARPTDQIEGTMNSDLLSGNVASLAGYLSLDGNGHLKETATTIKPNGESVDMLRQDWTLECWVRTTDTDGGLIARRNTSARTEDDFNYYLGVSSDGTVIGRFNMEYGVWVDTGELFVWVSGTMPDRNNIVGEIPVNDGLWHHVAYVRDDSFCYLYVDGLLDTKQDRILPPDIPNILPWPGNYWGVRAAGGPAVFGEDLTGNIDEMRIWNRALPTAELADVADQNLSGNELGLVSYFNFDFQLGDVADERSAMRDPDAEYGIYIPNASLASGVADGPPISYDPLLSIQGVALSGLFLGNDGGSWVEDRTRRIGLDPYLGWAYAGRRGAGVTYAQQQPELWDADRDTDGDGMPDWWERQVGLDPNNAVTPGKPELGPYGDPDRDGLSNRSEFLAGTDPFDSSTLGGIFGDYDSQPSSYEPTFGQKFDDGDRIADEWEVQYLGPVPANLDRGLDPVYYDAHLDHDGDRWSSYAEFMANETESRVVSPIDTESFPKPTLNVHIRYNGRYGDSMTDVLAQREYTESLPTAPAQFDYTLIASPVSPLTFSLRFSIGGASYVVTDTEDGRLIGGGVTGGTIDHETGAIAITFFGDATDLEFRYVGRSQLGIPLRFYGEATMDGFPVAQHRADSVDTLIVEPNTGHFIEGMNYVFGFLDVDGDGDWDPVNEPAGVANFNMGWGDWNKVELPLTDDRQMRGFPRVKWDAVDEEDEPVVTGYTVELNQGRNVLLRRFIERPRNYLHEGDYRLAGLHGVGGDGSAEAYTFTVYKNDSVYGLDFSTPHALAIAIVTNQMTEAPAPVTGYDTSYAYARNEFTWTIGPNATWYQMSFRANGSDAQPDMTGNALLTTDRLPAPFRDHDGNCRAPLPFYAGDVRPDGGRWTNDRYWVQITTGMEVGTATESPWWPFNLNIQGPQSNGGKSVVEGGLYYFSGHDYLSTAARRDGAVSNQMPVVVQSFDNPGFSGVPDGQVTLAAADWTNTQYRFDAEFSLMGLHLGAHYLRAFVDANTNGILDGWETWGYGRDPQTYYHPVRVSLDGIGPARIDDQMVVIRDRDTDTDGLPDIWEYQNYGSATNSEFLQLYGRNSAGANGLLLSTRWQYGLDAFTVVEIVDQNSNGIPDDWETYYFGRLLTAGEEAGDADGDGMATLAEYAAGTDPTNEGESLKVNRLELSTATPTLSWTGQMNYRVQKTDSLSGTWVTDNDLSNYTRTDIGGGDYVWTYTDPTPLVGGSRFYRILIVPGTDPLP